MHGLVAADLLTVWETGLTSRRLEQPLAALSVWMPERSRDDFAHLPIGDRDTLLLQLHAATFGRLLEGTARCPACGEAVEFSLATDALSVQAPDAGEPRTGHIEVHGYLLDYRLPDTLDLVAASATGDPEQARAMLAHRCIRRAIGPPGTDPDDLPDFVVSAFAAELARQQPASDIEVGLSCPACSTSWDAHLDVGSFVWDEIAAEARRLVHEVDRLARWYGWREADILAMTPARRRTYLALVE